MGGDPTVLYISDAAVGEGFDMKDLFIRFKAELAKIGVHRIIPVELSFVSHMMLTKLLKARKPQGDPTVLYISFPLDLGSPFALPTFADSPSKLVPTTVPLAYELLIG